MEKFIITLKTRWQDMDALGHINHAKYFTYFEQARICWWFENNILLNRSTGPILIKAEAQYLRALSAPSEITIELEANRLGTSSYWIEYFLIEQGNLCAKGQTKVVWVDYAKKCSVPLPKIMINAIKS